MIPCSLVATSVLKVEAVCSSNMVVHTYQAAWRQNPEDCSMYVYVCFLYEMNISAHFSSRIWLLSLSLSQLIVAKTTKRE